jgi:hypothetical protein
MGGGHDSFFMPAGVWGAVGVMFIATTFSAGVPKTAHKHRYYF